ncbi:NAD(P)H dehydrogenase subunit NdhS [Gloeobacter violaceus]|uniref:Gsl1241 protein n=1 Tax=Gloeobacter violaceus (strain ATCC 29082 / PCC 7421) TaxID=251221 RepID=Q7NL85_GLOVI|nr:NAD(P)H dehydrogenase subunit NdhS [Gloeobacter violaceus]BAC89182.1 gsl1241 [Gloeobacter violaceus PCC 7421]
MTPELRPGMPVKVINPRDLYYGFEGQIQKVVDGYVGVIFGGATWIKHVRFVPSDLTVIEPRGKKRGK